MEEIVKLPQKLRQEISDFISTLPIISDTDGQKTLVYNAGLDLQLQDQITFGKNVSQFVSLLISTALKYGKLDDGRYALEAILETAQKYIGQDRRLYCTALIKQFHNYQSISNQTIFYTFDNVSDSSQDNRSIESILFEPTIKPLGNVQVISELSSSCTKENEHTFQLYITDQARHQIFQYIGWGEITDYNRVEQGGILIGEVFYDPQNNLQYGVVKTAIFPKTVDTYYSNWKFIIGETRNILHSNTKEAIYIIGWFHTHPQELSLFMSETDKSIHNEICPHNWQCAVIFNPQRQCWRVFQGKKFEECEGFMIA